MIVNQDDVSVVTSKAELAAAFTEWERRYREEPEAYMTDQERLAETEETLGDQRAVYLLELLGN